MHILGAGETVAAFDVDAQQCFTPLCPDELPVPDGQAIVEELNRQAEFASVRIGSKDAHSPRAVWVASHENPQLTPVQGDPHADLYWNQHAVPGTPGFELINGLPAVTDYDFFVWKGVEPDMHPYGACFHDLEDRLSTGVMEYLRGRGVDTVIVGGLALDFCVKTTVLQLRQGGFDVVLNKAACRGLRPDSVEAALVAMEAAGVSMVESAMDLYFPDAS